MSNVYDSSVEAFNDLLSSQQVAEVTANLSYLTNGIEYSFVQVTCDDGSQYGLQAYGKEAIELHRVAIENLSIFEKLKYKKPVYPMAISS
jgi:hypothetical protein